MKTYDPQQVQVIVGGRLITGFAEDTFVEVERSEDMWSLKMGVDGEGTRSKSNNKSGQIRITLMSSSPSNAILQGFADADELNNGGLVPAMVKDGNGSDLALAEQAYIKKLPTLGKGKEIAGNQWVLETDVLKLNHGGN